VPGEGGINGYPVMPFPGIKVRNGHRSAVVHDSFLGGIFLIFANLFGLLIVSIASDIAEEQKIKKFLKDRNDDFTDVDATTKYNKRWKIFTMVKRHDDAPWMDYKFRVWYNRKTGKMHKGKIRWMHEGW